MGVTDILQLLKVGLLVFCGLGSELGMFSEFGTQHAEADADTSGVRRMSIIFAKG